MRWNSVKISTLKTCTDFTVDGSKLGVLYLTNVTVYRDAIYFCQAELKQTVCISSTSHTLNLIPISLKTQNEKTLQQTIGGWGQGVG